MNFYLQISEVLVDVLDVFSNAHGVLLVPVVEQVERMDFSLSET